MDEDVVEDECHGVCDVKQNKEVDEVLDENAKEHAFSVEEKEVNVNEPKEMPVESGTKQGGEVLGMDESYNYLIPLQNRCCPKMRNSVFVNPMERLSLCIRHKAVQANKQFVVPIKTGPNK